MTEREAINIAQEAVNELLLYPASSKATMTGSDHGYIQWTVIHPSGYIVVIDEADDILVRVWCIHWDDPDNTDGTTITSTRRPL